IEPVSAEEAEDYLDIISQPMDFQTMFGKFSDGTYHNTQEFVEDVKLVFSNAEEYNQQGSTVLYMSQSGLLNYLIYSNGVQI
uniref:Bromo domain-containing protein n=1 Tax=Periophthalmus magnuspinnatus TaxID=409849 RepID=A0A3B4A690_9GOBI